MTLHEAIKEILAEKDGQTPSQIASKINSRKLYVRKDGLQIKSTQISARVNQYLNLFEKIEGRIYLIKSESVNKISHSKFQTINETKCSCKSCKNIWYYGKKEMIESYANDKFNSGKTMLCCSGCLPALFLTDKKVIDHNACPKCGSRLIKKENITHYV